MKIIETKFSDVKIIIPQNFEDSRGFFSETYNNKEFNKAVGRDVEFVQDNHSRSIKGTLRGLHYQVSPTAQAKLVRVASGQVFDVVVDVRKASPTFGSWMSVILSDKNRYQLWVPEGFAHGFYVMSENADYLYKTTNYYSSDCDRNILWCDPDLSIDWPFNGTPILSQKDLGAGLFNNAEYL